MSTRQRYSHRCVILRRLDATMERTPRGRRSRRFLPWFARLVWCIEGGEVARSRNTLKAWLNRHRRTCPLHDHATTAP